MVELIPKRHDNKRVGIDVLRELNWDPTNSLGQRQLRRCSRKTEFVDGTFKRELKAFPPFGIEDAAEKAAKRVYGVRRGGTMMFRRETAPTANRVRQIARDAVHELESHISIPADSITGSR